MRQGPSGAGSRELRLRLGAEPASVPDARHFVTESLRAWGRDELVEDAALCVSELAGNATLHGRGSFIEVSLLDLEASVRLAVEDDDPSSAASITPRASLLADTEDVFGEDADDAEDGPDLLLDAPTTGRGLAIVAVLASDWGVEEIAGGKRVWADLAPDGVATVPPPPAVPPAARVTVGATPDGPSGVPDGWAVVRLSGCPVELSLRQDQHLDELVRELQLMAAKGGAPASRELAHRLDAVLRAPAGARAAGRRQATAALERGDRVVEVEMAVPLPAVREVRELHAAVQDADRLCEEERLLTLASSPELRRFRAWMTEEIIAQAEHGARPRPWDDWLAGRPA